MVKSKRSKSFPKNICKAIHDMSCSGVRNKVIAEYYKLKPSTVSKKIRRLRNNSSAIQKKRGPKERLSPRGLRLFQRYTVRYCFEPLNLVVARFSAETKISISQRTGRRYMKKLKMDCYVAVEKSFISKKNISALIQWALKHNGWTQHQWANVMFTDESSFF